MKNNYLAALAAFEKSAGLGNRTLRSALIAARSISGENLPGAAEFRASTSALEILEWDYRGRPPGGNWIANGGDAARGWAVVEVAS